MGSAKDYMRSYIVRPVVALPAIVYNAGPQMPALIVHSYTQLSPPASCGTSTKFFAAQAATWFQTIPAKRVEGYRKGNSKLCEGVDMKPRTETY